jgi:hypothetical protein
VVVVVVVGRRRVKLANFWLCQTHGRDDHERTCLFLNEKHQFFFPRLIGASERYAVVMGCGLALQ